MAKIGYTLSSEEHPPRALVDFARRAEESGFDFLTISDHFHPWTDRQGQSPFVWAVVGAVAQTDGRLPLLTAVTCPTLRIHPAIVAQAAATAAAMMPGRFLLGVGSGENLNEHVVGARWPPASVRLEMLEEAIQIIRLLWSGGFQSHRGRHYEVERARIYTLPEKPPPILMAASGPKSIELAGRSADGIISLASEPEVLEAFDRAGGTGKPRYAQGTVCWAKDRETAVETAGSWWPNAALPGALLSELATPSEFEQASSLVREEDVTRSIVCSPDPDEHVEYIREFDRAGYDHVFMHQVGPDQEGFFRFYAEKVLPRLR